jgi:RNA polymerase sigma-70 factor (ECF subfamily)
MDISFYENDYVQKIYCINTGKKYDSIAVAAEENGISSTSVANCCFKRTKSVKGLKFRFIKEQIGEIYSNSELEIIFERFKKGEEISFSKIYELNRLRIYFLSWKILKGKLYVDDAVNTIFLRVWNNKEKFSDYLHLQKWLVFTTRNVCIDILRYKNTNYLEEEIDDFFINTYHFMDEENFESIHGQTINQLWKYVDEFPNRMRMVFYLRFKEGKTIDAICKALKVNRKRVYNDFAFGMKKLKSFSKEIKVYSN